MTKPRILLSASQEGWDNYENALVQAGGAPVGGYCPAVDLSCDGLLLCGGEDVDPGRFGQANTDSQGIDPDRDAAEFALAEAFLAAGKPILGICRGHQVLNIALGGDLIQDVGAEGCLFHRRDPGRDADKVHPIRVREDSLLGGLYGPLFPVNSSHHQAVGRLGQELRAVGWSEAGIVEVMEHQDLPLLCVQFHPERMAYGHRRADTVDGALIFDWFLRRCGGPQGA